MHRVCSAQGIAQYYPKPELRQCGDIDLYVGVENYARSYDVLKAIATEIDDRQDLDVGKHYHVSLGKVEVEVHRYSENYPFRKQDEKYQTIASKGLSDNLVPMIFGEIKVNDHTAVVFAQHHILCAVHHILCARKHLWDGGKSVR